jgi:hypothetical protein
MGGWWGEGRVAIVRGEKGEVRLATTVRGGGRYGRGPQSCGARE